MSSNEIDISRKQEIVKPRGFFQVQTFEEAEALAKKISNSDFVPARLRGKTNDIIMILQMAQELDLPPTFALRNMASINDKAMLYGDGIVAVCRKCKDWEYMNESFDNNTMTAICKLKRRNQPEIISTFSKDDAMIAKLWGRPGNWTTYPKRMLTWRARNFALRDLFADVLSGFTCEYEASDIEQSKIDYSGKPKEMKTAEGCEVSEALINDEQLEILRELIASAGTSEATICQFHKVGCLDDLTMTQFDFTRNRLDQTISKQKRTSDVAMNKIIENEKIDMETGEILSQADKLAAKL